jgi:RNA recognition motif-containing protein
MLDEQTTDAGTGATRITIYVGNLAMVTSEVDLRQVFSYFGQVVSVTILNDDYFGNKHPKVYAYVGMADKDQGTAAIAGLDGKTVGGRAITVISALPVSSLRKKMAPEHSHYHPRNKRLSASTDRQPRSGPGISR